MAKQKEEKTNVMRVLEQHEIPYIPHSYPADGPVDGVSVAKALGQDVEQVFKTLVCKGASGAHYVFDIPVAESLTDGAFSGRQFAQFHNSVLLTSLP